MLIRCRSPLIPEGIHGRATIVDCLLQPPGETRESILEYHVVRVGAPQPERVPAANWVSVCLRIVM